MVDERLVSPQTPLSVLSHCPMGLVGQSMGIHSPTQASHIPLLFVLSKCPMEQARLSIGVHCPTRALQIQQLS